ncbi:MAG: hydroxymethylglutaryl-CoA reductase, degradative [Spirochaeta sp. LUC14_002_19_P3]|nr:MAG: hydroxymethylglutaryl-CoA reductase, degradative [Spirochaeta sp. LUC14_002_19_P3]
MFSRGTMKKVFSGKKFRLGPVHQRRSIIEAESPGSEDFLHSGRDEEMLSLSEAMVEQAVGYMAVPLGLAGPLLIDGRQYMIPLATEEPSVIAACSFAGGLTARHGGISTSASDPVMAAQIFIEDKGGLGSAGIEIIQAAQESIKDKLMPMLLSMENRGGGWRGMETDWMESERIFFVTLKIDVRDAMGANLLNSAAERVRPLLEQLTGGQVLMAILSNRCENRIARAAFSLPVKSLLRPGSGGRETAERIVKAARIARKNSDRAVTHNKGIMNGISALALAACNDTRAIEAAAHAYACRDGQCRGLSEYWLEGNVLHGSLEMPLPFAVTGGAVDFHPTSRWALALLDNPDARGLSRIAAAVGLMQNLAALRALVCEGIQEGHLSLHARRLSFSAGARGEDIGAYTQVIRREAIRSRSAAMNRFKRWKKEHAPL